MPVFSYKKYLLFLLLLLVVGCGRNGNNPVYPDLNAYDPTQDQIYNPDPNMPGYVPGQQDQPTYTVLNNVFLRVDPEVGVLVKHLEGRMEPKRQGDPIIYGDVRSFTTYVAQAEMVIDEENITRLQNKYTFNYAETPIKDVQVKFMPGRIRMSGKLKQVIWVNFAMEGALTPTPDGKILLTPDSIEVAGIQVKSLMETVGLSTSKMIKFASDRGLTFVGNNVILDPTNLFPPPKMVGRVVGVQVNQGSMSLVFNSGEHIVPRQLPDPNVQNYIHVYGGRVLIMNELHYGAEMEMEDLNPSDPFDFYLAGYLDHLKAGYVKVSNNLGSLITMMPDYTHLGQNYSPSSVSGYAAYSALPRLLAPIQRQAPVYPYPAQPARVYR